MTSQPVEKLIRHDLVAVMIAPSYGAGWSTWQSNDLKETFLFDRRLALAVEAHNLREVAKELYPSACLLTTSDVELTWVSVGRKFQVREYDGSESLYFQDSEKWHTA